MLRVLGCLPFLLISGILSAQLDPFYFGSYVNSDSSRMITVYTMDEVVEDCFIVEMDNLTLSEHWEGYGHCSGEDGRIELLFDRPTLVRIPIEFSILNSGLKSLTIFPPGQNSEVYLEKNE